MEGLFDYKLLYKIFKQMPQIMVGMSVAFVMEIFKWNQMSSLLQL